MGRSIFDPQNRLFDPPCHTGRTAVKFAKWDPIWTRPDRFPTSKCMRECFWTRILPPRPIYDLPGPRWEGRFSTPKPDFLPPLSYRPYSSQICQLGPHLDPSRPGPDLKMHAVILLEAYFDPPDPYMIFLDPGKKFDF